MKKNENEERHYQALREQRDKRADQSSVSAMEKNKERLQRIKAVTEEFGQGIVSTHMNGRHLAAVQKDGTVLACGDNEFGQCDVQDWDHILSVSCGREHTLGLRSNGTCVACGEDSYGQCQVDSWKEITSIAAGVAVSVGVRADGTVAYCGRSLENVEYVSSWHDIKQVACGGNHVLGLCENGTVVALGDNREGQCNVSGWKNVIAIACGWDFSLGLCADGTCVACGKNDMGQCDVQAWKHVTSISCGINFAFATTNLGRVFANGIKEGDPKDLGRDFVHWRDVSYVVCADQCALTVTAGRKLIIAFGIEAWCRYYRAQYWDNTGAPDLSKMIDSAERRAKIERLERRREQLPGKVIACTASPYEQFHIAAVCQDGTVVACGDNGSGQCRVSGWTDVVSVACGDGFTVGLRHDGTVLACGDNQNGQCNVADWQNVIAIACGKSSTVGLCADGTLRATSQDMISNWKDVTEISVSGNRTVVALADGHVEFDNWHYAPVLGWENIVRVYDNGNVVAGLREDGTILSCTANEARAKVVGQNVVDIPDCGIRVCGITENGTITSSFLRNAKDVVAFCSGLHKRHPYPFVIAVKSDGTVYTDLPDRVGYQALGSWKNLRTTPQGPNPVREAYRARRAAEKENIRAANAQKLREYREWLRREAEEKKRADEIARQQALLEQERARIRRLLEQIGKFPWQRISGGTTHTAVIKQTGTVVAYGENAGGQCDVSGWTGIVQICCGYNNTVGLKWDGTVVFCGNDPVTKRGLSGWYDIVLISYSGSHAVGLYRNGTVVACGSNSFGQCKVSSWRNIIDIKAYFNITIGLRADGTVVTTSHYPVSSWKEILAVDCGVLHMVGLTKSNTVVACGGGSDGQCNVGSWDQIVQVACGDYHTVALRYDGTVVACGKNDYGQCNVSAWRNVIYVVCGGSYTIGICSDGSRLYCGDNRYGQCDVNGHYLV